MNQGNQILETTIARGETIAIWAVIIAQFISLLVAYNERLRKGEIDGQPFFDLKMERQLLLLSKGIIFLTVIYFLYVSYANYRRGDEYDHIENKYLLIQLISSILVAIAATLTGYVVLNNHKNDDSIYENPEI